MLSLLNSQHAITCTCILSLIFTSSNPKRWVYQPLITSISTLLGGGIAGDIITKLVSPVFRPYVVIGILGMSILSAGGRYIGLLPPLKNTPIIHINYQSGFTLNENPISYTAHKYLENKGPILNIKEPLCAESIIKILNEQKEILDFDIYMALEDINNTLNKKRYINEFSGIFIHGEDYGYVMIHGPNQNSSQVISIKI